MIYITGIRLSTGGSRPSHITHLRWQEAGSANSDIWPREKMVNWIDQGGDARVHNAFGQDPVVRTVHPYGADPYVQTKPDNTVTDNLLSPAALLKAPSGPRLFQWLACSAVRPKGTPTPAVVAPIAIARGR